MKNSTTPNTTNTSTTTTNKSGFSLIAAVVLATDHFNRRDISVVPELADLLNECTVFFSPDIQFVDTKSGGHYAATQAVQFITTPNFEIPCAIAGPQKEIPALEISVLATAMEIPLVAFGGYNSRLVTETYHPFSSRTSSGGTALVQATASYLQYWDRTDFIAVLYPLSDIGLQLNAALGLQLDSLQKRSQSFQYISDLITFPELVIDPAIRVASMSGFRTIVWIIDDPTAQVIQAFADAAQKYGMNNGEFLWILMGELGQLFMQLDPKLLDASVLKLLSGSAFVTGIEDFVANPTTDPFLASWRQQNNSFVDKVNNATPFMESEFGYFFGNDDFFQLYDPEIGSAFLYDSVMSIGIGACLGKNSSTLNASISSADHLRGIRATTFQGASGRVRFEGTTAESGGRNASGLTFGSFNLIQWEKNGSSSFFRLTDVAHGLRDDGNASWLAVVPFIFADGRSEPPGLLRATPEQNYLSQSSRMLGFSLLSIGYAFGLSMLTWVFVYRKHKVLKAAQPELLGVLVVSTMFGLSAIIPLSFTEGNGVSVETLSRLCTSVPWFLTIGHIGCYMSLFTKLLRIHKVLQFKKRKVKLSHVLWPTFVMLFSILLVLTLFTAIEGFYWRRVEIDVTTGESYGSCAAQNSVPYLIPGLFLVLAPTALTIYIAWKTKDIDSAYSESSWIFTAILSQLQIVLLSVPVLIILGGQSSNPRYIGQALLIFSYFNSLLFLVMFPKIFAWFKSLNPELQKTHKRGSASGRIRITGVKMESSIPVAKVKDTKLICVIEDSHPSIIGYKCEATQETGLDSI